MRAVVLAAGVGSRLGALTACVPKCMIEIGGAPVLEQNLRWLAAAGVREVAINLHRFPEVVTSHCGDGSAYGIRIFWSYEPQLLGTAGTVASLRNWLDGDAFLVVYGDNIFDVRLDRLVEEHRHAALPGTVALFEREDVSASGVAEVDETSRVRRFVEKPKPGETASTLVNAGLLLLEPETLDQMPRAGDLAHDVLPGLAAAGLLNGHRLAADEGLLWIDTPADLERTLARVGVAS